MNLRKAIPLLLTGALALAQAPAPAPASAPTLPPAQQAEIARDVLQVAHQVLAATERLDLEAILRICLVSPDFAFTQAGGKTFNFAEMRKSGSELFGSLASQKMVRKNEHVIVLGPDAALFTWTGRNDLVQKDGTVLRSDPYACTYLFRKASGTWRFAFGQESGLPFASIKEGPASEK
jgi:hypothetical protein